MLAPQSRRLEERLTELERHIDRLEELVPRGEEVSGLLDRINERAGEIGVELARFAPGNTDRGNFYNRRTFEMVVHGHYHDIARFLAEIGSLSRIITPLDLSVVPYTLRGRPQTQQNQTGQQLEATFLIETYVLPEGAESGGAGA
jgi:type IV pilus assembly protein PilO